MVIRFVQNWGTSKLSRGSRGTGISWLFQDKKHLPRSSIVLRNSLGDVKLEGGESTLMRSNECAIHPDPCAVIHSFEV
jgi:hypothetical protein